MRGLSCSQWERRVCSWHRARTTASSTPTLQRLGARPAGREGEVPIFPGARHLYTTYLLPQSLTVQQNFLHLILPSPSSQQLLEQGEALHEAGSAGELNRPSGDRSRGCSPGTTAAD